MAKHVLISLVGRTPQIVTETLFALGVLKDIKIEEIVLVTTAEGRVEIESHLINEDTGGVWKLKSAYPESFFCLNPEVVSVHVARDLPDIRNIEENEHFIQLILDFIRDLTTSEDTVLHCSLAGGRKTMSVYMALALQFFGRAQDKLYHVLVNPSEFENELAFFYPPPVPVLLTTRNGRKISTAEARIDLVEVPYVRLRGKLEYLFGSREISFAEMVQRAQTELVQWSDLPALTLNVSRQELSIGDQRVYLPALEFAVYWFCAEQSRSRADEVAVSDYGSYFVKIENEEFNSETREALKALYHRMLRPGGEVPDFQRTQSIISKIRRKIELAVPDDEVSQYYIIAPEGPYGEKRYGIKLDKSKITIIEKTRL